MLPCVRTKCTNCGVEAYRSAGVVARALGQPLTDHTAALIPQVIGCLECGSNQVDVYYADQKTAIVVMGKTPCCRICDNHIPELFSKSFPLADFCPLCVAEGRVSDAQVAATYGELVVVYGKSLVGEAYRFMALQFRADENLKLKWPSNWCSPPRRKALHTPSPTWANSISTAATALPRTQNSLHRTPLAHHQI